MFSSKVREKLEHYVYLYIDPRDGKPFYVGKGTGNRCFAHLKGESETETRRRIRELKKLGETPRIDVLKHGLTEQQALLVEATAIDLLGIETLTNAVRGHGSRFAGRAAAADLAAQLDAKEVEVVHSVVLVNISRAYRFGMSAIELYDATRSAWKVSPKRHEPRFALSVYKGIVREVFEIEAWVPGGSTMRASHDDGRHEVDPSRWEFVGRIGPSKIRKRYLGRSVAGYFEKGNQNPIKYVNC